MSYLFLSGSEKPFYLIMCSFDVRIENPRSYSLMLADHFEIHPLEDFQQIKELGEIETEQLLRRLEFVNSSDRPDLQISIR